MSVKLKKHILTLPEQVAKDLIGLFVQGFFLKLAEHLLYLLLLRPIQLFLLALFAFSHAHDHVPFKALLFGGRLRIIFSHY